MIEMENLVILPEVRSKMKEGVDRIKVIIAVKEDADINKVKKSIEELGVKADATDFYLAAEPTPSQVEEIGKMEGVAKIWLNKKIQAMLDKSLDTIKAKSVWRVFGVQGEGIVWAVIDTGIDKDHPDLKERVAEQYDFTGEGLGDENGHGTHVAGIIAGNGDYYTGVAPKAKLYDFRVLDKNGSGESFNIIKAMAKIREMNSKSREIIIHGANLSLGSYVYSTIGSYGVGHSPECQEANRLVDSGVVVCVAASNDGYKLLQTINPMGREETFPTFMDVGISDPGNASEVITVGSTHKEYPHKYGISFFSSKGPTGDGRIKPEIVAPGEKIISCKLGGGYTMMSGTSMAAPHVSGALALLLSAKKEFIGQPREVKKILLANCTDLHRDKYFQGYGLLDIFRAMQAV